ncbi:amino acid adenylation domain-containing protein (plasmid) [Burkholderia sp. FERM BP-3421]|uniref:non-ribosomal peptide synthetase n=1 Tax=Burkholderia sp. FERM BP-3421 TaxID=1494466 RepID=UPI002360A2C1|nr:non-ribosomal peptide synthetase [Burkholderia sp. FERM BP-3421]WDD90504.1 amino acid adenylation domain-containing protein [Burkholderia sp. FERM BP-3421]
MSDAKRLAAPGNVEDGKREIVPTEEVDAWLKRHFMADAQAPLSRNQRGIWSRQMLYPMDPLYNVAVACTVGAGFDRGLFRRVCQRFLNHHQLLNARIVAEGDALIQRIDSMRELAWYESATGESLDACRAHAKRDAAVPFVLHDGPLYRIHIYEASSCETVVLLVVHHIICDGSSVSRWLSTIWQDYRALKQQRTLPQALGGASFLDFVQREAAHLDSAAGQKSLAYWRTQCADGLPPLDAALNLPPAADDASVFATSRLSFSIDGDRAMRMRTLRKTGSFSPSTLLMGAFTLALSAWRGTRRFTLGLPTLGRPPGAEFASTIGNFTNLVPVVCDLNPAQTFSQWLDGCQRYVYRALDHGYPFAGLLQALPRHADAPLSIQTVFTYQKFGDEIDIGTLPDRVGDSVELAFGADIFQRDEYPVTCEVVEAGDGWTVNLKYKTAVIEHDDAEALRHAFVAVLDDALTDPDRTIGALTARDDRRHGAGPMQPASHGPAADAKSLCARFTALSRRDPARRALSFDGRHMTYGDLDRGSDALARHLVSLGVRPGDLVLLCVTPSPDLITAILAILKAGAAYVPIDPGSPAQRIEMIREDSGARFVVTTSISEAAVESVAHRVVLDRDGAAIAAAVEREPTLVLPDVRRGDLAYVIYTSGTTGKPKGVMIEHGNVLRLFDRTNHWFDFGPDDVWTLFHSAAFDFSVWEIWGALLYGGRLVILDTTQRKDPVRLLETLADEQVTVFNQTPAAFYAVVRAATAGPPRRPLALRLVVFGGERLDFGRLAPWIERYGDSRPALINMYGITETTVHVTHAPVTAADVTGACASVIGHPIPDLDVQLLDEHRAPVPDGEIGEMYVGGAGVARGYLNRPELTQERFVTISGVRCYKTGDLARRNARGELEYIGRNDAQVKIRGYRIELGEIEACMNQHPVVEQGVVIAHEHANGTKHLVAYYRARDTATDDEARSHDLRAFVAARLPEYMVPAFFVALAELPLTGNGKFDRQSLSRRPIVLASTDSDVAGASATQQRIRELWQQVLGVAPAHFDQGFFEAGGDSLSVVLLARAIEQAFGHAFTPAKLFRYATVRDIAAYLETHATRPDSSDAAVSVGPRATAADELSRASPVVPDYYDESLAIIGISCEFPGAADHLEFWANLLAGRESVEWLTRAALDEAGVAPDLASHPDYVSARFTIPGKTRFDADFFKLSAKLAEFADPQSRQLLMHAWKAVEDAGYVPGQFDATGVFVSTGNSGYQTLLDNAPDIEQQDRYLAYVMSQGGSTAALISYQLGLTGPSMQIGTNCSSSLVAIDAAFKSLRAGECRQAIVGASTLFPHANAGFLYQPGLNFSSTGHCRTFDVDADGMMAGEGVAVIVLKNARQAVEDGDAIYAVLRSIAVNNDGRQKSGFYAPSAQGQGRVIRTALERAADIDVESIAYVEAHGTGTRLGDPVEVMAIDEVYRQRTGARQFCAIGSVKPNIGHLDTAAGLAGCIKVALALRHRMIPPTINVTTPNPAIDWASSCFRVPHEASPWPEGACPPRAALSSFGLGGTNAHAILEACPDVRAASPDRDAPTGEPRLVLLSAAEPRLLPTMARTLSVFLVVHPDLPFDAVAATLQRGRQPMRHRLAIIATGAQEAAELLERYAAEAIEGATAAPWPAAIVCSRPDAAPSAPGAAADAIAEGLARRDLSALAALWVEGHDVDWSLLHAGAAMRRVHLPTYPFARRRYEVAARSTAAGTAGPRLAVQLATDGSRQVHIRLRRDDDYLDDHRVDGRRVLPAVMTFELLRAAAMTDAAVPDEARLQIEHVVWLRPVICDGEALSLCVELAARGVGQDWRAPVAFRLTGVDDATNERVMFAEGALAFEASGKVDGTDGWIAPEALRQALTENRIDGADWYRGIAAGRVQYGPTYLGLVEAGWNDMGLTARVRLPESVSSSLATFPLHPALLDCALQASVLLDRVRRHGGDPGQWSGMMPARQKLPFFVERVDVLAPLEAEVWVRVQGHEPVATAREARYDIFVHGASGALLVAIREFVTRALPGGNEDRALPAPNPIEMAAQQKNDADTAPLHTLTIAWTPLDERREAGVSTAPIVLFGIGEVPPAELVACFAGRVVRYVPLRSEPDGPALAALPADAALVFALPAGAARIDDAALIDAQRDGVVAVFRWLRALIGHGFEQVDLDCTFVVERTQRVRAGDSIAPVHAGLIGLAQSLAGEYGHWRVRLLDVGGFADLPTPAGWPNAEGKVVFAWRDGRWFTRSLVETAMPTSCPTLYRQGGHYVVLGGAGGIGRTWTETMIRDYRARVVWLGRKPRNREIDDEIARLGKLGPAPIYLQADATDPASLRRARHRLTELGLDTLHGVVHSALVLDDRGIAAMSDAQFARALDAKVATSVNLARVFGDGDLDFMLFYSGTISFVNPAGQSNYAAGCSFQDAYAMALADQRRCAVKLVHWGYWGHVGAVATPEYRRRMAAAGVGSVEPEAAMQRLAQFMQDNHMRQIAIESRLRARGAAIDTPQATDARPAGTPTDAHRSHPDAQGWSRLLQRVDALREHNGLRDPVVEHAALLMVRQVLGALDALPVDRTHDGAYRAGPRSRLAAIYERWYQESCRQLQLHALIDVSGGATGHATRATEDAHAAWARVRDHYRAHLSVRAGIELMDACLRNLPAILRGELAATTVMFPDSSMRLVENVHRNHPIADYFNEGVAEAVIDHVRHRVARERGVRLRILEIGAGTGGTSSKVLPNLLPWREQIEEYRYTDLSKSFLFYAEDTYGADAPFLKTAILDIEAPTTDDHPHADKFGSYDMVIAANVLHATRDIGRTLRHAKAFMRDGGVLVLNEMSENCAFSHLTFGLLEGWWRYDDEPVRIPGCPGLSPLEWRRQLERAGFVDVQFPLGDAQPLGQQVIVAQCRQRAWLRAERDEARGADAVRGGRAARTGATAPGSGAALEPILATLLAEVLRIDPADVDHERSFSDIGLDSILAIQLTNRLNARLGIQLGTIELFDHNTVAQLAAHLTNRHRVTEAAGGSAPAPAPCETATNAAAGPSSRAATGDVLERVTVMLREHVARAVRVREDEIDLHRSFADQGVDSIISVQIVNRINKLFGLRIATTVMFDHNTVGRLAAHLCERHGAALAKAVQTEASTPPDAAAPDVAPARAAATALSARESEPSRTASAPPAAGPGSICAVLIDGPGEIEDLSIAAVASRGLDHDEVRVAVRAFSLNFSDLLCARGLYPNMPPYPFVPGNEAAGVVIEVGAGVSTFRPGDEVVCLCQGCHAEQVICTTSQVFAKPASWSFEEACALPIVGITMIDAFSKAALARGERILIQTATGGTGLIAVQLAMHRGAEIFATAGSEAKLRYLRDLGIAHTINYRTEDFAQELARLAPGGVDVVINTLGGDALQKGIDSLGPGGRYIEIAMTSLRSARSIDLSSLSDNQTFYSVDLARMGARDPRKIARYWDELVSLTEQGVVRPTISEVVAFRDVHDAYRRLADRGNIGKIVVRVDQSSAPRPRERERGANLPARDAAASGAPDGATEPAGAGARVVRDDDIAIIGMSGRFARSPDLDAFWSHLASGTSLIAPVTRWDLGDGDARCETGSFLDDLSTFDPFFFKISGTEARYMDPQQRLFLEEAWKALEDAGHAGELDKQRRCGVYVGCSGGDYHLLFPGPGASDGDTRARPPIQSYWGNAVSVIPARISYFLDLHGPAVAIDTACSSSLVALHMACAALRSGEVSMALCGGVFVQCTAGFYQQAQRAGMLSTTGNCYAFDARADGFVPGEGVGAIVLKRLGDAIADGDHIDGVILASGINQDGSTNGITAPSARSQEELETDVYDRFGIDPRELQMVEAHGTGTPLGDPIEFTALANAFGRYTRDRGFCALGSVKTNIGHTTTTAGIAGVLKILLALRHRQLPPSCNFERPNPEIELDDSPFYVNTRLRPWRVETGRRRMAAVSSFGFSGTNAHVVIAEAPPIALGNPRSAPGQPELLVVSAQTHAQLNAQLERMAAFASGGAARDLSLADIAFTLADGRRHMRYRWACVASSVEEFAAYCGAGVPSSPSTSTAVFQGDANEALSPHVADRVGDADLISQARRFVAGGRLDSARWTGRGCRRVRLPVYPFARESYWVETPGEERNPWPPLEVAEAGIGPVWRFSRRLEGSEPFLRDHRVLGESWLPAVVYWEMTRWSARQAAPEAPATDPVVLRDVIWQHPLSLAAGPRVVEVRLERDAAVALSPRFRFVIESRLAEPDDAAARLTHCSGSVEIMRTDDAGASCLLDLSAFRRQAEELDVAECYRAFAALGIEFGPSHRGLKKLYRYRDQLLAQVGRSGAAGIDDGYLLSPTITDAALQVHIGNVLGTGTDVLPLPYAMDSLTIVDAPSDPSWVWIRQGREGAREHSPSSMLHDIDVFDEEGRLLLAMRGCRSAPARRRRIAAPIHPLVHERVDGPDLRYRSEFIGDEFFLDGHRIAGVKILPAACYLEMAREVSQRVGARGGVLRDIFWLAPYQAPDLPGGARPAPITVQMEASGERHCRVVSTGADGRETTHFVGRWAQEAVPDAIGAVDVDAILRRTSTRLARDAMNALVEATSSFGAPFQVMTWLQHGADEALAAYRLPAGQSGPYHWHPGILSAALGAVEIWIAARGETGAHRLPYGIGSMIDHARPTDAGYIHVRRVSGERAMLDRYDIDLLDADGRITASLRGYSVRPWLSSDHPDAADAGSSRAAISVMTGTPRWRDAPTPAPATARADDAVDRLFFVPDHDTALHAWLRDLDPAARLCPLPCGAIVDDDGMARVGRVEAAYRQAFEAIRAVADGAGTRAVHLLMLVHDACRDEAMPSLQALIATAALEYERIAAKTVFYAPAGVADPSAAAYRERLRRELLSPEADEPEVRLALSGERQTRRVAAAELPARAAADERRDGVLAAHPLEPGDVVWLVGGMGGIGQHVARDLAARGLRVTISGRSVDPAAWRAFRETASTAGERLDALAVDIADADDVKRAVASIVAKHGRIDAVIHSAGVIGDAYLRHGRAVDAEPVFASKLRGGANLDDATRDLDLKCFVLFSSLSALGSPGQAAYAVANAYLNQLALQRNRAALGGRRRGRSFAIGWPLWLDGGMAMAPERRALMRERTGLDSLTTDQGLAILDAVLNACRIATPEDGVLLVAPGPDRERIVRALDARFVETEPDAGVAAGHAADIDLPESTRLRAAVLDLLKATVAAQQTIAAAKIDDGALFLDLGYDSISLIGLARDLGARVGLTLQPTLFFEYPVLVDVADHLVASHRDRLAAHLGGRPASARAAVGSNEPASVSDSADESRRAQAAGVASGESARQADPVTTRDRVAVIGMSCRFPGSDSPDAFWRNLTENLDLVGRATGPRASLLSSVTTPSEGGFVDDIERFDPQFFGLTPMEAEFMDPQFRLFLQCAWRAVEDAGYRIGDLAKRRVGVFVGVTTSDYRDLWLSRIGAESATHLGLAHFMIANRASYQFDLRGPSEVIDTACSSSLVAIHRACESLACGNCEIAIVGGVNVIANPAVTEAAVAAGMLSPDGRCKTFDSSANGFGRGEGVGVVVLKRMADALADGDHLDAVVVASGENHGGRSSSPSAPNPDAQRQLIVDIYRRSGIDPASVGYVEAHGTGTALGDPIEIKALVRAFAELADGRPAEAPHCAIGSVKANIGHLEAAAGISAFIKTVLMLKHGKIPGNPHLKQPNPYLELDDSPFTLASETCDWPASHRRAGVSSFGLGGSNAHIVLDAADAYPAAAPGNVPEPASGPVAIGLSARRPAELDAIAVALLDFLSAPTAAMPSLRDLAFTLDRGRETHPHRLAFLATDIDDVRRKLARVNAGDDAATLAAHGVVVSRAGDDSATRHAHLLAGAYHDLAERAPEVLRDLGAWVRGEIDTWRGPLAARGRRVSLPTYPFGGKSYWLPEAPRSVSAASSVLHPLLHREVSAEAGIRRFASIFSGEECFLADHRVQGQRLLPGVASLEMALAAACLAAGETGDSGATLRNVVWSRPVIWGAAHSDVALSLSAGAVPRAWRYRLGVGGDDTYGEGEVALTAMPPVRTLDLERMRAERDGSRVSAEACYRRYREVGIEYGPSHRGLERLYLGSGDVLAEIALPAGSVDAAGAFRLHPGLLDAAWQAVIGLTIDRGQHEASLPFALDEIRIVQPPRASRLWAWIRPGDDGAASVDMDIALPDGRIAIELRGLHTRQQVAPAASAPRDEGAVTGDGGLLPAGEVTLSPVWESLPAQDGAVPSGPRELWVFGSNEAVRAALEGTRTVICFDSLDGTDDAFRRTLKAYAETARAEAPHLLWISGGGENPDLDPDALIARQSRGILPLFRLINALIEAGLDSVPLALTVVTRRLHALGDETDNDISDAGVVGLVGTVAHEYPHWTVRHWDVDAPVDDGRFFRRLDTHLITTAGADGDVRVHRGGRWHRQRLARVVDEGRADPVYREGGVYLVIGGAGGLGRTWSRHMIERFGAQIVWLGRRAPDDEIRAHLAALSALGRGGITYLQADATDAVALKRARAAIMEQFGALHGIVHAPIVLADRSLARMDETAFRLSYDAKLKTCANLYPLFAREPLDFVLFFSSLNAFSRSAGQGNYVAGCTFTDAYARKLDTRLACDVKVINWGYWGDVGIVAGARHRERALAAGLDSISAEDGLRAIDALLARPGSQVAYVRTARPIAARHYDSTTLVCRYPRTIPAVEAARFAARPAADLDAVSRETLGFRQRVGALAERLMLATLQQVALAPASGANAPAGTFDERLRADAPPHVDAYAAWLAQSHRLLVAAGHLSVDGEFLSCRAPACSLDALWQDWRGLAEEYAQQPGYVAQLELLESCLRALGEILRGDVAATDVMFPGGGISRVEGIYRNNAVSDHFNHVQSEAIAAYVEARVRMQPDAQLRLLEIGAGTGGTTDGLLRRLEPWRAHIAEYCYTDVSKAFLIHGETRYGERYPFLSTKRFDVEKAPAGQGIAENHYDVVLATNVLHATASMRDTMRHLKAILRPSGIAVVNEVSEVNVLGHVTFGLLPGWWRSVDPELRIPGGPALSPSAWATLGAAEGLRPLGFPAREQHALGQQIIVFESDGVVRRALTADASPATGSALTRPDVRARSTRTGDSHGTTATVSEEMRFNGALAFVQRLVADTLKIDLDELPPDEHFQSIGLDSILVVQLTNQLRRYFDGITSPLLFKVSTVRALTEHLWLAERERLLEHAHGAVPGADEASAVAAVGDRGTGAVHGIRPAVPDDGIADSDVAIIGMSGRFPGAPDLAAFWRILRDGVNCISEVPPARWRWQDYDDPELSETDRIYTRWGGFIEDIDRFDPLFFQISPKDAEKMDPQERLFLEEAYRAIEDAGYTPCGLSEAGSVGVFVGAMNGTYNAQPNFWSIANRVSYCFDLSGPSMAIDTACSSSLTALHTALESLHCGSCDAAIVGGVSLIVDPVQYQGLCAMTMLSPGNRCKAFGADADGFVDGEGVGVFVLKPLRKALADGDAIHGVLKGSAINAGGKTHGYTVPNPARQSETLRRALERARVAPAEIGYIEAHGTGTALGDPIEIAALTDVFEGSTDIEDGTGAACPIGSVKSNIGHLESAAGVAGVAKVLLQLRHRQLVASLHAAEGNPEIDFSRTPFRVQQNLADWTPRVTRGGSPARIAGVSSFGAGGANAHVIVAEPPMRRDERTPIAQGPVILVLSARSADRLRRKVADLVRHLETDGAGVALADLAFTLQTGREPMPWRVAWLADSVEGALDQLRDWLAREDATGTDASVFGAAARQADAVARRMLDDRDLASLARIWTDGARVDWARLCDGEVARPRRLHLPTYPFAGGSYWRAPTARDKERVAHAGDGTGRADEEHTDAFNEALYASVIDHLINQELDPQAALRVVQSGR